MNKKIIFFLLLAIAGFFIAYGVKYYADQRSYHDYIKDQHEKYRTLWYRTDSKCFYDSSRKYGLIYDSILGINQNDVLKLDTLPYSGNETCN